MAINLLHKYSLNNHRQYISSGKNYDVHDSLNTMDK